MTVATFAAVDPDTGDTFTYTITGGDSAKYEIVGNEIRVRTGIVLDFETDTSDSVTVQVTDAGGLTFTKLVAISITNYAGTYTGTVADDTVTGTSEEDVIDVAGGNDVVIASAGGDTINGGTGTDTYNASARSADMTFNLGSGVLTATGLAESVINFENFHAGSGNDLVIGTAAENTLSGGAGTDHLQGNAGDDVLLGGAGADILDGGADSDTVSYADAGSGVVIKLSATDAGGINGSYGSQAAGGLLGDAAGDSYTSIENVIGSRFDDRVFGGIVAGNYQLGDGADIFDTLFSDTTVDTVSGGLGDDIIISGDGADTLNGDDDNDSLTGEQGNDSIDGGAGTDRAVYYGNRVDYQITFSAGTYTIVDLRGGLNDGTDTVRNVEEFQFADGLILAADVADLVGTASGETLNGGTSARRVFGLDGSDTINTGVGNDYVDAGDGDDQLRDDGGTNTILFGAGNDILRTAAGTFVIDGGAGIDTIDLFGNNLDMVIDLSVSTVQIANASLTLTLTGIEWLSSGHGNDVITGNASNNSLTSRNGNDVLYGLDGDDTFEGGDGSDQIFGGNGFDTASYNTSTSAVFIDLLAGSASGGEAQGDTLNSIEAIRGSGHNDGLTGDSGNNALDGNVGDDLLVGSGGNDWLDGNVGTDTAIYSGNRADYQITFTVGTYTIVDLRGGSPDGTDTVINVENFQFADGTIVEAAVADIQGTLGDDALSGGLEANRILGSDGDDTITGGGGNDALFGGSGNDTITGGAGADQMNGGGGVLDVVSYTTETADLTIDFGLGTASGGNATGDTFQQFEVVRSGSGNDTITGGGVGTYFYGGVGNDVFIVTGTDGSYYGGAGADQFIGNGGLERVRYSDVSGGAVTVNLLTGLGSGGHAAGDTYSNIEGVEGSNANDTIIGNNAGNELSGYLGADTITGGSGADYLYGGYLYGTGSSDNLDIGDVLDGQGGNDIIYGAGGDDSITGGQGDDQLFGGRIGTQDVDTGNDTITGGAGNDTIDGGAGTDTAIYTGNRADYQITFAAGVYTIVDLRGGSPDGTDTVTTVENFQFADGTIAAGDTADITLDNSANTVTMTGGQRVLFALGGDDTITGTSGNDRIDGGAGLDALSGGAGDDVLILGSGQGWGRGGTGADIIDGSGETDPNIWRGAVYGTSTSGVTIDLLNNIVTGGDATGDTLININYIDGSDHTDTLSGTNDVNYLYGQGGDDVIAGRGGHDYLRGDAGADTISGDAGNDLIAGGTGGDTLNGGADSDWLVYGESTSGVTVDIELNLASGGDAQGDVISNFEHLAGSNHADTLTGRNTGSIVFGLKGGDAINGGNGADQLYGDNARSLGNGVWGQNETLTDGADTISGGGGDDLIEADTSLILNGLFESFIQTGSAPWGVYAFSLAGWTQTAGSGFELLNAAASPEGGFVLDMDNSPGNVAISQVVTGLANGETASLSLATFDLNFGSGNAVEVRWGGVVIGTINGTSAWVINEFTVTGGASAAANTLELVSLGPADGNGIAIDNVRLYLDAGPADWLDGGGSNDTIHAGGGADTIFGGNGNDRLFGQGGDDTITGGAGMIRFEEAAAQTRRFIPATVPTIRSRWWRVSTPSSICAAARRMVPTQSGTLRTSSSRMERSRLPTSSTLSAPVRLRH